MSRASEKSLYTFVPFILLGILGIVAVIIILRPGSDDKKIGTKEVTLAMAFDKMNGHKSDCEKYKAAGESDKADRSHTEYLKWKKIYDTRRQEHPKDAKDLEAKWANQREREKVAEAQELPSDDPIERNRALIEKKFADLKELDATLGTGTLNCPDIPAWTDSGKTESAGKFSHRQWVKILEESSGMVKIQRRTDKKEGWIEAKYIRDIYTKEKLDNLKIKDPNKPKDTDEEDDKDSGGGLD